MHLNPPVISNSPSVGSVDISISTQPPSNPSFGDVWVARAPISSELTCIWHSTTAYPMIYLPAPQDALSKGLWVGHTPCFSTSRKPLKLDRKGLVYFLNAMSIRHGLQPVYKDAFLWKEGEESHISPIPFRVGFRVPSLDEWVHLAQAGTNLDFAGSNDPNKVRWPNYANKPVGKLLANKWGLKDMQGNHPSYVHAPTPEGFEVQSLCSEYSHSQSPARILEEAPSQAYATLGSVRLVLEVE